MIGRLLVFIALLLAGCSGKDMQMQAAVQNYCSVTQAVFMTGDVSLLATVATQKEIKKVFPGVMALRTTGNVMRTEVPEFRVIDTSRSWDAGTVETREKWVYWWEERGIMGAPKEKKTESYHLRYRLVKERGKWKVDSIENLE